MAKKMQNVQPLMSFVKQKPNQVKKLSKVLSHITVTV